MALPMRRIMTLSLNGEGNNNPRMRSSLKKCLFGPADPAETARLAEESFSSERQRFFERFGIDMDDLENVAVDPKCSPKKRKFCSDGKQVSKCTRASKKMRALKPYNGQTKITDFCQIKKKPMLILQSKKP